MDKRDAVRQVLRERGVRLHDSVVDALLAIFDRETQPLWLDDRFYTHDLNEVNMADLRNELLALDQHRGRLVGIVDNDTGDIIAYALGKTFAERIVTALRHLDKCASNTVIRLLFDLDPDEVE